MSRNGRWVKAFKACEETIEAYFWFVRHATDPDYDFSDYCQSTLGACKKAYRANCCLIEAP